MWILFATASSFFAGITTILAKRGIQKTNSTNATAIRTIIVLIFSWIMVFITKAQEGITQISTQTFLFLIFSGLATGASWLCYFHALQIGDVNKVVPIDKSSTVLTIILSLIFFQDGLHMVNLIAILLIGIGTLAMIDQKASDSNKNTKNNKWLLYAFFSAIFASLTTILSKLGLDQIDANLATAIRTTVVLVMSWIMVFINGKPKEITKTNPHEMIYICLSGVATGISWLMYFYALQSGPVSVVVSIDKLSILVTILFSVVFLHETLTKRAILGVFLILVGTILLAIL